MLRTCVTLLRAITPRAPLAHRAVNRTKKLVARESFRQVRACHATVCHVDFNITRAALRAFATAVCACAPRRPARYHTIHWACMIIAVTRLAPNEIAAVLTTAPRLILGAARSGLPPSSTRLAATAVRRPCARFAVEWVAIARRASSAFLCPEETERVDTPASVRRVCDETIVASMLLWTVLVLTTLTVLTCGGTIVCLELPSRARLAVNLTNARRRCHTLLASRAQRASG